MFCFIVLLSTLSDAAEFNYGIVFSSRTLEPNEKFEVQLEDMAWDWSGALEIGVTTFNPEDISEDLPSTMSLMESGTWMLVGESVLHRQQPIKENYSGMDSLSVSKQEMI
jgi:hypothetical protein